jgi:hypothetical protein
VLVDVFVDKLHGRAKSGRLLVDVFVDKLHGRAKSGRLLCTSKITKRHSNSLLREIDIRLIVVRVRDQLP